MTLPLRLLLGLGLVLAQGPLAASPPKRATADLDWRVQPGTQTCAPRAAIVEGVERELGRPVFASEEGPDVIVHAVLAKQRGAFRATLVLEARSGEGLGERRIQVQSGDCRALTKPVILALALMLDIERPTAETTASDGATPGAPQPEAARARTREPSTRVDVATWLAAAVAFGQLPAPGPGLRLGFEVAPASLFPVELSLSAWLARDAELGRAVASFARQDLGLFACPAHFVATPLDFSFCAGGRAGRLHASGVRLEPSRSPSHFVLDLGVRPRGRLELGRGLFLETAFEATVPLYRTEFLVTRSNGQAEPIFRMYPIVVAGEVGLGVH